jgi:biotin transport system substrate-specific component
MRQSDVKPATALAIAAPSRSVSWSAFAGVLGCSVLVAIGAQVRIPVPGTEVPMTLQSLAVLLTGFALRPSRAAAAMLLYIVGGAAGLPLFAPGSLGVLGPTGGYLLGFVPAAWLVSVLRGGSTASYLRLLLAGAAGTVVIFALGALWPWRAALYGGDAAAALMTGLMPFAAKAVVQLFLAASLVVSVRGLRRDGRRSATL